MGVARNHGSKVIVFINSDQNILFWHDMHTRFDLVEFIAFV